MLSRTSLVSDAERATQAPAAECSPLRKYTLRFREPGLEKRYCRAYTATNLRAARRSKITAILVLGLLCLFIPWMATTTKMNLLYFLISAAVEASLFCLSFLAVVRRFWCVSGPVMFMVILHVTTSARTPYNSLRPITLIPLLTLMANMHSFAHVPLLQYVLYLLSNTAIFFVYVVLRQAYVPWDLWATVFFFPIFLGLVISSAFKNERRMRLLWYHTEGLKKEVRVLKTELGLVRDQESKTIDLESPVEKILSALKDIRDCSDEFGPEQTRTAHEVTARCSFIAVYYLLQNGVSQHLSNVEQFCLLLAAAIHDTGHTGRTNGFHVATRSSLSLTYNDKSVQENMHLFEAFRLMYSPDCFFLQSVPEARRNEIRSLVIELVLATDISMHLKFMSQFNAKRSSGDFNPKGNKDDRLLLMQLTLKVADINNIARPTEQYRSLVSDTDKASTAAREDPLRKYTLRFRDPVLERRYTQGYTASNTGATRRSKITAILVLGLQALFIPWMTSTSKATFFLLENGVSKFLNDVEQFCLLLAAAIHDTGHTGRTNGFHVATRSSLSLTYNDKSVQENMHLFEAFRLMYSPDCFFLQSVPEARRNEIRSLVIELVLATDISMHLKFMSQFNAKRSSGDFDPEGNKDDRLLLMQLTLKVADINNIARPTEQYRSAFMDRGSCDMSRCQTAFADFIVMPMLNAFCPFVGDQLSFMISVASENKLSWSKS
eukprot:m51a1_g8469 hypothetical protein (719) ;mRNA; f:476529-481445